MKRINKAIIYSSILLSSFSLCSCSRIIRFIKNKIDENKNKATYLIHNDDDKKEFIKNCNEVINKLKDRLN